MFLLLFALGLVLFFGYHFYWKRRGLPPGPLPLPVLGSILPVALKEPGYDAYRDWAKVYGPVFTHWIGPIPFVIFADYPTIKETVIKDGDSYTDRYVFQAPTDIFRGGRYGVIDATVELWKEHRRFTLHVFRNFGLGKNLMMERVLSEVSAMLEHLKVDAQSGPVQISEYFDRAVGSIINNLLFGYRFDDDKLAEFRYIKGVLSKHMKDFSRPVAGICFMFPILLRLPYLSYYKRLLETNRDLFFGFFREQIKKHEASINFGTPLDESTDYVEYFLKEMKRRKDDPGNTFTYPQLENMCTDLWVAGMETTSNTLAWGILYTLHNPHVQEKIHAELDEKIGSDRLVENSDRNELHYVNAFINEVQRMANLLPQNLMRRTVNDVEVNGFKLPKGTNILPQISCVLYDEKIFPEPDKFKPERFLDENGHLKKVEELVPFSIGKRVCLGEGLARMELFLFLANIFNQFEILPEDPKNLPTTKKVFSVTMQAQAYKIQLRPRF